MLASRVFCLAGSLLRSGLTLRPLCSERATHVQSSTVRLADSRIAVEFPARSHDGPDDAGIAGTAADLAAELVADRLDVGSADPTQNVPRHDQHAGRAEAALQGMAFVKVAPEHLQDRIVPQPFKGDDGAAVAHHGEHEARPRRLAVDEDRAGPAGAVLAAEMCRDQAAALAHEIGEAFARLDPPRHLGAVDLDLHVDHHACSSLTARRTLAVCSRAW